MTNDYYTISIDSEEVENFDEILASVIRNLTLQTETIPDFKVSYTEKRINISIFICPAAFLFMAQLIQEITNFNISFSPCENIQESNLRVENKTEEIKEYILTLNSFTRKELKEKFPTATSTSIDYVLFDGKKKGYLTLVKTGCYRVNKT